MKYSAKQAAGLVPIGNLLPTSVEKSPPAPVTSESGGIWAEPQLFLLPFCVPQDKAADRSRAVEITEKVRVNGVVKERTFRVNPDPRYGLPGSFDLEVMLAIYHLAANEMARLGKVPEVIDLGSLRSFIGLLGKKSASGKYMNMVKEALKRLACTTCCSEGFFYSKPRDLYVIESFQFLTSVTIAGETAVNGRHERTTVRLHAVIRENLNSNFRTLIDFDYIRGLKTDIAKTLSLHLSYRFHKQKQSRWEADYRWIAERLAVKVYEEPRRQHQQFKPALDELVQTGFLESYEWLPSGRIRFIAGQRYIQHHQKRVAARDAWLQHAEDQPQQLNLLPSNEMERLDPLAAICAKYAAFGWSSVRAQAAEKTLTKQQLQDEAAKRGYKLSDD